VRIHATFWWRSLLTGLSFSITLLVIVGTLMLFGTQAEESLSCRFLEKIPGPEVAQYAEVYCAWLATHLWLSLFWLGAFTFCLGLFLWLLWSQRYEQALASLLGALVLIYAALYPSWLTVTGNAASPRAYAQLLLERLGAEQTIAFINPYDEKGVPVLFALQEHILLKDVQWPWGTPQPHLLSGYYLVTENRRKELQSDATGTWTEVLHDTGVTKWPITLFFYSASAKQAGPP